MPVVIETNVARLARVLCWLAIDPRESVSPATVWRDMRPEVREGFKRQAQLVIDQLAKEDSVTVP